MFGNVIRVRPRIGSVLVSLCVLGSSTPSSAYALGLASARRANPMSSRLVASGRLMLAIGWVSLLHRRDRRDDAAPIVYLDPNMMAAFALCFAGAVLGASTTVRRGVRSFAVGCLRISSAPMSLAPRSSSRGARHHHRRPGWRPSGLFGRRLVARV